LIFVRQRHGRRRQIAGFVGRYSGWNGKSYSTIAFDKQRQAENDASSAIAAIQSSRFRNE
jgi:hypothetical protein